MSDRQPGSPPFWRVARCWALPSRQELLSNGSDPCRIASAGAVVGIFAFAAVVFSPATGSINLFRVATTSIGFGSGLFAVGMLTAAMELADTTASGLVLGAWGAVQATAAGLAVATSGGMRDAVGHIAMAGDLGRTLQQTATGYSFVYHTEILMLFINARCAGTTGAREWHFNSECAGRKIRSRPTSRVI